MNLHGPIHLEAYVYINGRYSQQYTTMLLNFNQIQTYLAHIERMVKRYRSYEIRWNMQDDMGRAYTNGVIDSNKKKSGIFVA